jgi:hypothetical protein
LLLKIKDKGFGKMSRTVKACLLTMTLLLATPALALYVSLAVQGKRLLSFNEWGRFAGIISFAGIAHMDTKGGPRAWAIAGESLSDAALSQVSLESNAQTYEIPLPPNTIRQSCDRLIAGLPKGFTGKSPGPTIPKSCLSGAKFPTEVSGFISIAAPEEMARYTDRTLPAAGWIFEDRLGSAWFFRKKDTRLMMGLGSYLTVFIVDFSLDLTQVPRKNKQRSKQLSSMEKTRPWSPCKMLCSDKTLGSPDCDRTIERCVNVYNLSLARIPIGMSKPLPEDS